MQGYIIAKYRHFPELLTRYVSMYTLNSDAWEKFTRWYFQKGCKLISKAFFVRNFLKSQRVNALILLYL